MPKTAGELALYLQGELVGDPSVAIRSVASLDSASEGDLVYADSEKTLPQALASPASVVIVGTEVFVRGKTFIRVSQPRLAFARTLAWLVPRFLRPTRGRMLFDGADIAGASLSSVRDQVAFVFQETQLFDATVEENLRIGRPEATDAGIAEP